MLDGITASKVSSWDNKSNFDGNYNSLTNKPNIPSIEGLATENYVDNLLNIDYESLLAFDVNEIIRILNYVDSDNSIILDDSLPAGTYTLKYEFEDGTYADITNFIISNGGVELNEN